MHHYLYLNEVIAKRLEFFITKILRQSQRSQTRRKEILMKTLVAGRKRTKQNLYQDA
ncbi:hypothetical protein COO91_01230 [Nostoc flagelliforme CCNUN1]|uniref:Uncharacterized protein n=1 Tax=Nostoc flagelliforme CCNUN1 TaxID=2038116 RepID=A0A2K8SIT4_9NOSO|nr:hypothetical protein COO91_01230 [Nostoc flagelliforme CCNUN1]